MKSTSFDVYLGVLCELFGLENIDYRTRKEIYIKTLPLSNSDLAYVVNCPLNTMEESNNLLSNYPTSKQLSTILAVYKLANEVPTSNKKLRSDLDSGIWRPLLSKMSSLKLIDRPDRFNFIGYSDRFEECWPDIQNFTPEYNQNMNSAQKRARAPKDWQARRIKLHQTPESNIGLLRRVLEEQITVPEKLINF